MHSYNIVIVIRHKFFIYMSFRKFPYCIDEGGLNEQLTLAERGEFHENLTPILRVDYSCAYNNL